MKTAKRRFSALSLAYDEEDTVVQAAEAALRAAETAEDAAMLRAATASSTEVARARDEVRSLQGQMPTSDVGVPTLRAAVEVATEGLAAAGTAHRSATDARPAACMALVRLRAAARRDDLMSGSTAAPGKAAGTGGDRL